MNVVVKGAGQGAALKLCAAVAVSCAVHSGAFVLPYLGSAASGSVAVAPPSSMPDGRLRARLTTAPRPEGSEPALLALGQEVAIADQPTAASTEGAEARPSSPQRTGLGLLPIEGPTYYPSSQLTRRPMPLAEVDLNDPVALPVVASGKMIMTLWINTEGEVDKALVEGSELPRMFTGPTVAAFRRLRFKPGELNGQPVRTVMKIEVTIADDRAPESASAKVFSGEADASPQVDSSPRHPPE